jgi:hypothetical protein
MQWFPSKHISRMRSVSVGLRMKLKILFFYTLATVSVHLVLTNLVTTNIATFSLCIYITKPDIIRM